jgi:hypothetical protein
MNNNFKKLKCNFFNLKKKKEKLHFTLLNYPPICIFALKVSNMTLKPPETFKLLQFDHFDIFFFFPKCPHHIFYF